MSFFSNLCNKMVLREETATDKGYTSAIERTDLLGASGTVKNELKPAGIAIFDKSPVDVVSEGDYIMKGAKVEVVSVNGSRIVVREMKE